MSRRVGDSYGTRGSRLSYQLPQLKTQRSHSFQFCAILLWNDLPYTWPYSIKCLDSKDTFKAKCKGHLMNRMKLVEDREFVF